MVRALQLFLGLILATGGGWFIWLRKDSPGGVFNVTDTETLWLVAMGLVLTLLGLVLFLMGLSPRAKVEQINWRYPEPAPEVDLSGPAFADNTLKSQSDTVKERPSWLQTAADELHDTSPAQNDDNNASGVAAAGVALIGGAAVASALSNSESDSETTLDDPQYPRDELPFERPRFGAQDVEDTSAVSLVDTPLSFDNPATVETSETEEIPSVEQPSTQEEEEQALEELNTAIDSDLVDADIEALALEAAHASMEESDELQTRELESIEDQIAENLELQEDLNLISSEEDQAFEDQLGALSPTVHTELSSLDIEAPLQEAEVIPLNNDEESIEIDIDISDEVEVSETIESSELDAALLASEVEPTELETADIVVADQEAAERDVSEIDPALDDTLEITSADMNNVLENVIEETEEATPIIEEADDLSDVISLENASLDLPDDTEKTSVEELVTAPLENETQADSVDILDSNIEESISAEPESDSMSSTEDSEMDADEISATIDEFNAEIAGIATTEELKTPELEEVEISPLELEAAALPETAPEKKEITTPEEVETASIDTQVNELNSSDALIDDELDVESAPLEDLEEIPTLEVEEIEESEPIKPAEDSPPETDLPETVLPETELDVDATENSDNEPDDIQIADIAEVEETTVETEKILEDTKDDISATKNELKENTTPEEVDPTSIDTQVEELNSSDALIDDELDVESAPLEDLEEIPPLEVEEIEESEPTKQAEDSPHETDLPETVSPETELDVDATENSDNEPDDIQIADIAELPNLAQSEESEELPSKLELEPHDDISIEDSLPALDKDLPDQIRSEPEEITTPETQDETLPIAASSSESMNIQDLAAVTMTGPTSGEMIADIAPPAPIEPRAEINPNAVIHPRLQPVRDALDASKLEEADSLLANIRRDLVQEGDENTPELAELTALAGDHAAASGRPGGAKWLWRLALQRFGEADAIETPAAKAVSERLRQFDN